MHSPFTAGTLNKIVGRGGEEVEALKRAGIPYEIVPGLARQLPSLRTPVYLSHTALVEREKFQSPTVVVVAEVVILGRELHWFSEAVVECRLGLEKAGENSEKLSV